MTDDIDRFISTAPQLRFAFAIKARPLLEEREFERLLDLTRGKEYERTPLPRLMTFGLQAFFAHQQDVDGVGLLRPLSATDVRFHVHKTFHIQSPDHDPGSPRAPPLTA